MCFLEASGRRLHRPAMASLYSPSLSAQPLHQVRSRPMMPMSFSLLVIAEG